MVVWATLLVLLAVLGDADAAGCRWLELVVLVVMRNACGLGDAGGAGCDGWAGRCWMVFGGSGGAGLSHTVERV